MASITLRSVKGSALTFQEGDDNFSNLNTDKLENITSESIGDLSDVDITNNTDGNVLTYNSSSGNIELQTPAAGGISNVVEDTTPQLGGNLDAQSNNITSITTLSTTNVDATGSSGGHLRTSAGTDCLDWGSGGGANVSLLSNMTCGDNSIISVEFKDYKETVYSLGSTDTPSISISNGNIQSVTITSGLTLPAFSDAATGQTVTLIVDGSGTATGTVDHIFAGGNTTLTTKSIISIFYDGSNYWTSIATDFQ